MNKKPVIGNEPIVERPRHILRTLLFCMIDVIAIVLFTYLAISTFTLSPATDLDVIRGGIISPALTVVSTCFLGALYLDGKLLLRKIKRLLIQKSSN